MYGKRIRLKNPKKSAAQVIIYRQDRKLTRDRTTARLQVLQQNPLVDLKPIAAIGYCFGGGTVLELVLTGAGIAGVVSFHGNLDTPWKKTEKNEQPFTYIRYTLRIFTSYRAGAEARLKKWGSLLTKYFVMCCGSTIQGCPIFFTPNS